MQVRATGSQQSPYIEDLKKAEEAAQGAARGLWTKVCIPCKRRARHPRSHTRCRTPCSRFLARMSLRAFN